MAAGAGDELCESGSIIYLLDFASEKNEPLIKYEF